MRLIFMPLIALPALGGVALPTATGTASPAFCHERIEQVRDAAAQPALDKTPGVPGQGYLIAAVDKRIDGCAVMQMKGDVNDLRPLPVTAGPARLQPAH
jgi:hypothetical protein